MLRSHYCGELRPHHAGQEVAVAGWIRAVRDHGGLLFLDLRDRSGVVQVVFHPEGEEGGDLFRRAQELRAEYVVLVRGEVGMRPPGRANPALPTGEVEVIPSRLEVLAPSLVPPFEVDGRAEPDESLRLRYRYLDLRRPVMLERLGFRHRAVKAVRDFLDSRGFWEVETPALTRSTPEGARDYLVPSRVQPGHFYALPQSPQLFKQLLMMAGVDRYFQIARCFRDEDLRADRQPEFTQIDLEMAFADEGDVLTVTEEMMAHLFRTCLDVDLELPFPRLSWDESMDRFGTDKPDLRLPWEIADLSDLATRIGFRIFRDALAEGGTVRGLRLPGITLTRREIDDLTGEIASLGGKGLAWLAWEDGGQVRGSVARFLGEEAPAWRARLGAGPGDTVLILAGPVPVVRRVLGFLRAQVAEEKGATREPGWRFLWVTGFPLLEWNEEEGRWQAEHHPFTSPVEEHLPWLETDPGKVRARCYDLVLNGEELGSGSIRIHRRELQERVFGAMDISAEEARERFGFLLEAFGYGAPPHGGIALGLDRLLMLMVGAPSMRDVIAFPKTARASCPLTGAPAPVSPAQLNELHLRLQARCTPGR